MSHLPQLSTAAQLLEAAGLQAKRLVDGAQGLEAKIELACRLDTEVQTLVGGIAAATAALLTQSKEQVASLTAQRREDAVSVVTSMLADGTLDIAQLAKLAGVAPAKEVTWVLPKSPEQIAADRPATASVVAAAVAVAPTPAPVAPANASRSLRENMAVQSGYLNPVKFRDPATGAGWSGRGPMPKWLKDLAAGGKSIEDYRVGAAPAAAAAPVVPVVTAPAAEARATVPAPSAPAQQPEVNASDADIGTMVSFDASGFDADVAPAGDSTDDIGDIVDGIASMQLPGSDGMSSFMAA